ncbi:hypothetical protein BCR32DRAFT_296540 [Anaeromyces robustus]|uniref:Uncharacterized protein n=1 Tax=Anaeromyces robustus TaxID=1754192 RepID=A0A1Y1WRW8_9FUNG|nr:hypothetical protein BCR32DRAFT_296540 [Anaeromyces robustus]|eukprot:ORX76006.1 hypothetical protein BCR32DRAFT_296540 [Anaeromyces robustus]
MKKANIRCLKIITIIMLVLSIPYFNMLGIIVSSLTLYGIQMQNHDIIKKILILNILEAIIFGGCHVVLIVLICLPFFSKRSLSIRIPLLLLAVFLLLLQIYYIINIYIYTKNPEAFIELNEKKVTEQPNENKESNKPNGNDTIYNEPPPSYKSSYSLLPSYKSKTSTLPSYNATNVTINIPSSTINNPMLGTSMLSTSILNNSMLNNSILSTSNTLVSPSKMMINEI